VSDEQYVTLLAALGDIQAAVDAIGLDVEAMMEDLEIEPRESAAGAGRRDGSDDVVVVPEWVNRKRSVGDSSQLRYEQPQSEVPPPERGLVGMPAALLVMVCVIGALAALVFLLWWALP
jgi:hypothetical protein